MKTDTNYTFKTFCTILTMACTLTLTACGGGGGGSSTSSSTQTPINTNLERTSISAYNLNHPEITGGLLRLVESTSWALFFTHLPSGNLIDATFAPQTIPQCPSVLTSQSANITKNGVTSKTTVNICNIASSSAGVANNQTIGAITGTIKIQYLEEEKLPSKTTKTNHKISSSAPTSNTIDVSTTFVDATLANIQANVAAMSTTNPMLYNSNAVQRAADGTIVKPNDNYGTNLYKFFIDESSVLNIYGPSPATITFTDSTAATLNITSNKTSISCPVGLTATNLDSSLSFTVFTCTVSAPNALYQTASFAGVYTMTSVPRFGYFANGQNLGGTAATVKCDVDPFTGVLDFNSCQSVGNNLTPGEVLSINGLNAYVGMNLCQIESISGSFDNCVSSSIGGITNYDGIAFSNANNAYLANTQNQNISILSINSDGSFASATSSALATGVFPTGAIALDSNNVFLGAVVGGVSQVLKCPIVSSGLIGTCQDSGVNVFTLGNVKSITFNNGYVYYTFGGDYGVLKCKSDNTECTAANSTYFAARGYTSIGFSNNYSPSYPYRAYLTQFSNSGQIVANIITMCDVDTNGDLTNCNDYQNSIFNYPISAVLR